MTQEVIQLTKGLKCLTLYSITGSEF